MNTQREPVAKEENTAQQLPQQDNKNAPQEDVQISLPKTERPEGPFEHSGETAGWTKQEEEEEKEQQ